MIVPVPIAALKDAQLRKLWLAVSEALDYGDAPPAAEGLEVGLATEGRLRLLGRKERVYAIHLPLFGEDSPAGATPARVDMALWCKNASANYRKAEQPEVARLFDVIFRALVVDERRVEQARQAFELIERAAPVSAG